MDFEELYNIVPKFLIYAILVSIVIFILSKLWMCKQPSQSTQINAPKYPAGSMLARWEAENELFNKHI